MDIKELNKTQLILLTLLITFVVSIATGIITVSLMQQMPKSVPQTINNVIQRTIEKVTTVPATPVTDPKSSDSKDLTLGDGDAMVSIYTSDADIDKTIIPPITHETMKPLGQGIIISDSGLILIDSSILNDKDSYRVTLNKIDFDAIVIKKFNNGFSVLKISPKKTVDTKVDGSKQGASAGAIDNTQ